MTSNQILHLLGDENIQLNITIFGDSKIVYINLHENEQTSVEAANEILKIKGGIFIEVKSKGDRLISFNQNNKRYSFDPNRIFSSNGIKKTLLENGLYHSLIENHVSEFAQRIINQILSFKPELIIALHNTTGDFAVDGFLEGREYENDAAEIFINPLKDKSDFFFTIDHKIFDEIKKGKHNVILQKNDSVADDGSLSVYCARNGLKYVNIEALHGHKKEQIEMIEFANGLF